MHTRTDTGAGVAPNGGEAPAHPGIPAELDALIERVERHQRHLRLNDARFAARYSRHLRSADSWSRTLRARDLSRLTPRTHARWMGALRDLLAEVESPHGGEAILPLPILAEAITLHERLLGSRGDIRVGWLLGTTGVGKTVSLRHIAKTQSAHAALVSVTPLWRDTRTVIVRGLAGAVGVAPGAADSTAMIWDALVARLCARPTTLLVDEMHEGGVLLVKIIKALIEQTPARFLLTTWPSGFARLASGAEGLGETRQLVGRSLRPICHHWTRGLRLDDTDAFLAHAAPGLAGDERRALAREWAPDLARWGLRLLTQAVDAAAAAVAEDAAPDAGALRGAFDAVRADVLPGR